MTTEVVQGSSFTLENVRYFPADSRGLVERTSGSGRETSGIIRNAVIVSVQRQIAKEEIRRGI